MSKDELDRLEFLSFSLTIETASQNNRNDDDYKEYLELKEKYKNEYGKEYSSSISVSVL